MNDQPSADQTQKQSPESAQRIPLAAMLAFTKEALLACGLPAADADAVAEAMIEADLTGSDAHGIFRLGQYVKILREGRINAKPQMKVLQRGSATALVDGDNGMGHLVMTFAANTAVELAKESGVGWVGARRSNHAGAAGVYAAIPLRHGMIGIYGAVSSANHMAPWGGSEPLLGTNPIAVAIPARKEAPIVLDIATSVASFGTIRTHVLENEPMPEGWIIDRKDGKPITDPKRVPEGVLLPIGGHKGSGLALIIGILAGTLNGAAFARDVRDFTSPGSDECNTGQFVIALDVTRFLPPQIFAAEVDRHLRDLKSSAPLPGFGGIRMPGEERRRRKEERSRNGVELSAALLKQLDGLAGSLKLKPLTTR
jgi:LDH2 family malate/lactate/ureidoglycolate dehydrogenase